MIMIPQVSLVVPVYNETSRLLDGLRHISDFLRKSKLTYEILLIDDGSVTSVESYLLASSLKQRVKLLKKQKKLRIIRLKKNSGKGAAIMKGVAEATGKYTIFTDVDCSVPMTFIPEMLASLKKHHIAIGSRRLSDSTILVHQPRMREQAGKIYTVLSNSICQLHVSDVTCGFKGFRTPAARKIFSLLHISRWSFDAEVLFLARKYNYSIQEVPVAWTNKLGSRVKPIDSLHSFLDLIAIRIHDMHGTYDQGKGE